jgi:hypothetical protein
MVLNSQIIFDNGEFKDLIYLPDFDDENLKR